MKDIKVNKTNRLGRIAQAWSLSIEQLSHTLATKMATLQLKQQGLQKVIPSLLNGYHLAVEKHLMEDEISSKMLQRIEEMQNLDEQLLPMFKLLEQLNDYSSIIAHHRVTTNRLSAQQCLDELIANYPFEQNSQKKLIILDSNQDFEFSYPRLFIETSLRHLLEAALQRILNAGKGDIQLWVSDESDYNVFNLKDTSQGLTDDQLINLFSRFLFESYDKTRPGLGFCRLAILQMGGDIICKTANDEGTHIKIMLPKTDYRTTCLY
ncbi:MAG: ATP-binding protein [Legionellaceae bacterium]|nr:ATP-binding protein [Legionellaceae bacterium]